MKCPNLVPVGKRCPVCNSIHTDNRKRNWLIVAGIVTGTLVACGIILVYVNRRNWLYADDWRPIFGFLPELPVTRYPSHTGETPPRNVSSLWVVRS